MRSALLVGLIVAIAVASYFVRVQKIGITPDSRVYLGRIDPHKAATWVPPAYLLLLRVTGTKEFPIERGRELNATLLALAFLVLSAWLLARGAQWWAVVALGVFLSFAYPFTFVYRFLWTEPLAMPFLIAWLAALDLGLERKSQRWLLISAGCLALGCLTRYVMVIFVGASVLALLLWTRPISIRRIALYASIALLPLCAWLTRNWVQFHTLTGAGRRADRIVDWPQDWEWERLKMTGGRWTWPLIFGWDGSWVVAIGPFVWLIVVAWIAWELRHASRGYAPHRLALLAIAIYLPAVLALRCTADAAVPFDLRMLCPAYLLLVLAVFFKLASRRELDPVSPPFAMHAAAGE